jgi:2-hydroxychromene-2-carboxylate isomerase
MLPSRPEALKEVSHAAQVSGRWGRIACDGSLEPKMLRSLADRLGLDVDRFASEMGEESHLPHVLDDFGSGVRSGVNGTPTFFVDGDRFEWDHERGTLDRAVASAGARPAD